MPCFFLESLVQRRSSARPGEERCRSPFLVLVLLLSLASACSRYEVHEIAPEATVALENLETRAEVTVGAEAIVDPERQKALLGADLSSAGFLPVLLSIQNRRGDRVLIQRHKIRLVAAERSVGAARRLDVVNALKADGVALDFGGGSRPGLVGGGGPGAGGGLVLFPLLVWKTTKIASNIATRADMATDYARKEFRDSVLAPGEEIIGTLFFRVTASFEAPRHLLVPVTEVDSGAVHEFRVEVQR